MYAHVRKGSAKVKVGDVVRAGDVLAEVGNAGFSTEPHLHLAYYTLDASGRVRALPMAFPGLSPYVPPAADGGIDAATVDASDGAVDGAATDAATATVGVPHGRTEYTAP